MAKTLPGAIATEVAKIKASEPIMIVEVQWSSSVTKFYCARDFGIAENRLLEISSISTITKIGTGGSSSSASVKLSDTDGFIKDIIGTSDIHKVPVNVYLCYATLTFDDKYLLLTGQLNTPAVWDDAERTFSFEIVSKVEDKEIGFSPEDAVDGVISEEAVGKAWPLCFGSPLHVPAVRINGQPVGTALFRVQVISGGTTSQICSLAKQVRQYERIQEFADSDTITFLNNAAYQGVLENLGSASTSLTQAVASAVAAGANASGINTLIAACKNLQDAETDVDFWSGQSEEAQAGIDSASETVTSLDEQIATVEAERTAALNAANPDVTYIASLTLSISALESSKIGAQNSLQGFIAAKTNADANVLAENANVTQFSTVAAQAEAALIRVGFPPIVVKGGDKFPQGEVVKIAVNGLTFTGTFSGENFTTIGPVPFNPNDITPNSTNDNDQTGNILVASIGQFGYSGEVPIQGQYSWLGDSLIYINGQFGNIVTYTPGLFKKEGTIGTIAEGPRDIYSSRQVTNIGVMSPFVRPEWIAKLRDLDTSGELPAFASGLSSISYSDFTINVGDEVRLLNSLPEVYVANLIPSVQIREVMAYRTLKSGERKLVPVPSSLYTINLSDSLLGQSPTTITTKSVLSSRIGENWEDDLFVSLESTVGPNTSDVLKWIVENYSDVTADAASFATLNTQLAAYPSHFAILDRRNVLTVLEEIAWQARSAIYIRNDVALVKYLAFETASVMTVDDSNTEFENLSMHITPTEDVVTVFRALWNTEYTEEEKKEVVLRNNIPKYGTVEQEYDFYIYNIENLVVKSATFWMIRNSNTWKLATLTAMFNTFALDEYDNVTLNYGENIFGSSPAKGMIESISFDADTMSLVYEIWTSIRCGELTQYPFAWPANADPTLEYPTAADLFAGGPL